MNKLFDMNTKQLGLLIFVLAGIWVSPVHAQNDEPVLFAQPSQILLDKLGDRPWSVAVGDVNGDGALDIVTANTSSADVTVLAGDGGGGFEEVTGSPFAAAAEDDRRETVVLGDINGDGALDIATTNIVANEITVLAGDGGGGFTEVVGSPFAVGDGPTSIALGDVNGDGTLDIIVPNVSSNDITVLVGDGGGDFEEAAGSPFAVGDGPKYVALGDVDSDGARDVVAVNQSSDDVTVLAGDGGGGFAEMTGSPYAVGDNPQSVVLEDVNSDGTLDIISANKLSDNITVLAGDGSGGFAEVSGSPFPAGDTPRPVALGDINDDGAQDIVAANRSSSDVTVLIGDGSGGFEGATGSPFAVGSDPTSVALSDINGDNALDIVTANRVSNSVTVLGGDAAGGFAELAGSPITFVTDPNDIALGDIDKDGTLDAVIPRWLKSDVLILRGQGNGVFSAAGVAAPVTVGDFPLAVALGDVNGDAALDIVATSSDDKFVSDGDVTVLAGDGSGNFAEVAGSPFAVGGSPVSVALGDVNGDVALDIVTVNRFSDNVTVLLSDVGGNFAEADGSPFAVGDGPESVALGEITGDGALDIVAVNRISGDITMLAGDGSGNFSDVVGSPFAVKDGLKSVALGDINGDGAQDIVSANDIADDVTVLVGDGVGGFVEVAGSPFAVGTNPQSVALGDINGDGTLDIATTSSNSFFADEKDVTVLAGDGAGGFSAMTGSPFAITSFPVALATGLIDSDAVTDVVVVSTNDGTEDLTTLTTDVIFNAGGFEDRKLQTAIYPTK